uniref:Uncharacterized protein n=1 Tax=viral metagenome TaxID=1070528 RepID=A0A6C0KD13_9ZZZZ|tara:strand:+ start:372 stop:602 length:231 start_codon:yes stop_codon:yes gene_type:complete
MDNNYEKFKLLIEDKKEKYPNVCKLWKHHIDEKFKTFKITLERAITVLETIESKSDKDLPMETIAFLYFLFQENIP